MSAARSSSGSGSGSSSSSNRSAPRHGNWRLFLRQRRLMAQLGRLRNDFKHCYCPDECNGGLYARDGVPLVPGPQPARPVHAPFVRVDSDLPRTWARPYEHRDNEERVVAEVRGTSDILLHRDRDRATLRMSLQVRENPNELPQVGYFGEIFLTRWGRAEEFVGFIQSYRVNRRTDDDWEDIFLSDWAVTEYGGTGAAHTMRFLQGLFNITFYGDRGEKNPYEYDYPENVIEERRTENAMLLPAQQYQDHFAAAWTRISDETTDILYIPLIWIRNEFQGQRIIGQAFELLFRLITGGTLPPAHNINRPLSVFLEAGRVGPPYQPDWRDADGDELDYFPQLDRIARGYERCGFMRLVEDTDSVDYNMGRSVDPSEYPAASGDMAIVPPNPADSDLSTPSPVRADRPRGRDNKFLPGRRTPVSPSLWRGRNTGGDGGSSAGGNDGSNDSGNGSRSNDGSNNDDQQPAQGSSGGSG